MHVGITIKKITELISVSKDANDKPNSYTCYDLFIKDPLL